MTHFRFALLGIAAGAALALSATAASADGRPSRAPVREAVVAEGPFSWTGFYVGLHIGAGWSDVDSVFTAVPNSPWDHTGDGFLAGGQVGFNWQVGSVVLGVEASASATTIRGDAACPNPAFRCGSQVDSLASIRGRLGVTPFGGRTLVYGTAGWGWAEIDYHARPVTPGGFENSERHSGLVVGGGVEHALTRNVSFKVEYLGFLLDDERFSGAPLNTNVDADPTIHTVTVGLNVRF